MALFDYKRHKIHMERSEKLYENHRFLHDDLGAELIDRLQDIKRNFHRILDLSPHSLPLDTEKHSVEHHRAPFKLSSLEPHAYDLIISNIALHWVEDPPEFLTHIKQALKPDGLFLASFFGGDSLHELRTSLMEAELQITGGASLRTAPMIRLEDAPSLLGHAGFSLPVVDSEKITITYSSLKDMVKDLRGMGETLKTIEKSPFIRHLFPLAEQIYKEKFARSDGKLPVTVEVITLTGWAPCSNQQKPLKRGSATHSLEKILK